MHIHREEEQDNTFYVRLPESSQNFPIFGGGEQYNYFDLRNSSFDIFVNEQGVGRGENLVSLAQKEDGNTGKYDTSYWPLPVVVSQSSENHHFWMKYDGTDYTRLNFIKRAVIKKKN